MPFQQEVPLELNYLHQLHNSSLPTTNRRGAALRRVPLAVYVRILFL